MFASPISASEAGVQIDPLDRLWAVVLGVRAGVATLSDLPPEAGGDGLEAQVAQAVRLHLGGTLALGNGEAVLAEKQLNSAIAAWDLIEGAEELGRPAMTPRSNAFHMRLAARHGDFYRRVERDALFQWLYAARFRSRFMRASALWSQAKSDHAVAEALATADAWRASIPPRLPGLVVIEGRAAEWAAVTGDAATSQRLADRAASLTGRMSPWPEDGPRVWAAPRHPEAILRFAAAATVVDWPGSEGISTPAGAKADGAGGL